MYKETIKIKLFFCFLYEASPALGIFLCRGDFTNTDSWHKEHSDSESQYSEQEKAASFLSHYREYSDVLIFIKYSSSLKYV